MESRNNANNNRPLLSALSLRKSLEPLAYWKLQHFLRAEYPDTIPYLEKIKGKRSKMTRDEWERIMGQETIRATEFLRRAGVIRIIADGTKIEVAKIYAKALSMRQPWTKKEK